jgi:PhoH-like ATPase
LFEHGQHCRGGPGDQAPKGNHFFILKHKKKSILAKYDPRTAPSDRVEKKNVFGIGPKNAEQALAMSALLDPEIKLVTLQGAAGTGKTLLAWPVRWNSGEITGRSM